MIIDITTKNKKDIIKPWLMKQENKHIAKGHIGTHLDTYLKSEINIENFKRRGVLINASNFANVREIEKEDVENIEIKEKDFVIFRTDCIKKGYGTKNYFENHPQLSNELIKYLCKKKISFIGIDAPGIRRDLEHTIADKFCEQNGIYVIENLDNLDKINFQNFNIYTMWIDDEEATGLNCRVICEKI